MSQMEMEFPGDAREAQVRGRRNISEAERWCSMAAGVGLAAYGLSRRRGAGWLLAVAGALLFRRGISGHCHTYELLGVDTVGTGSDTRRALGGSAGVHVDETRLAGTRSHSNFSLLTSAILRLREAHHRPAAAFSRPDWDGIRDERRRAAPASSA